MSSCNAETNKFGGFDEQEISKPLTSQGYKGLFEYGAGEEIRTLDPHLGKVEPRKANGISNKGMRGKKKPLTLPLTLSPDNPSTDSGPELPPDLAGIVAAWPSIPDQIRQAVKAIVAPYLDTEGGK